MRRCLLALLLSSCSWLTSDPAVQTEAVAVNEDPAANLPKCVPADHKEERGAVPWEVGDTSPNGWTLTALDAGNMEFIRMTWSKGGQDHGLEVAYNEAGPGDWSTKDYRLMPAPEQEPPPDLLADAMAMLNAAQAAEVGGPFVRRRQGVDNPYAGLPPCGPDGNPIGEAVDAATPPADPTAVPPAVPPAAATDGAAATEAPAPPLAAPAEGTVTP